MGLLHRFMAHTAVRLRRVAFHTVLRWLSTALPRPRLYSTLVPGPVAVPVVYSGVLVS